MAKPGPKIKPRRLSLVKNGDQPPPQIPRRQGKIVPPKKLTVAQQKIWDQYVEPSWWLQQCDALLAYMFVNLMAEFIRSPKNMVSTRIAELRKTMAELHISSSEQARLGIDAGGHDPADQFFND